jgi:hypothetical protein
MLSYPLNDSGMVRVEGFEPSILSAIDFKSIVYPIPPHSQELYSTSYNLARQITVHCLLTISNILRMSYLSPCLAESTGLEPVHRFLDDGLAIRSITTLATLHCWHLMRESNSQLLVRSKVWYSFHQSGIGFPATLGVYPIVFHFTLRQLLTERS